MNTIRLRALVAAAALGLGAALPAVAADDPLQETALKLNDLKDTDAMQAKLTELLKDKPAAKKLVQTAAKAQKQAKGKKPFNYNAALVLAKVAHSVKDYDDADLFYEHAAELATKEKSGEDMLRAYEGLMDLFADQKKYDTVEEIARKMLDLKGGKDSPTYTERTIRSPIYNDRVPSRSPLP